ncbi:NAD(P)H-dependent oxidoreductase [Rhizobiales bacterium]|uniref:NADPH-dependent FMN reductase n=1 Tax=Hongsoonwoonella zoysiae TaxID=2821844 RepID=UPI0015600C49|nr:NAD(P)H-dependent oxidoreductase [Hongsoonwoonella zoysiae]NRG16520.1 NAD(P)H-dependent oxidoreductase [Hongsoonwoonella zoysiae]
MQTPKILVFAGSIRSGSHNARLAGYMAKQLALADTEVTHVSLADYPMPIYDGDLEAEEGVPENAKRLKKLMTKQHGVFIASPEYNSSITPLLKNTIDWISRLSDDGEPPSAAFKNRVFAVGGASPGRFGGMRSLITLRTILEIGVGALVIPNMVSVPEAKSAFDEHGNLKEGPARNAAAAATARLIEEASLRAT